MTVTAAATKRLEVVVYDAAGLGDRSYLLHDGEEAFVVDPQRDPGPYLETAARRGVDITLVLETHVHNDYVSGGLALARRTGATYGVPAGVHFGFSAKARALEEGDLISVGELQVRVLSTPGHTPHHLSFLAKAPSGDSVVLTGGSLLPGATGRTDLFGPERAVSLAEAQWRSVRRLLRELAPGTKVLPTHGFGSFCAASIGKAALSDPTIQSEREHNPAARLDLDRFVADLLRDPLPVPAYYSYMAPLNRTGAAEPRYGPLPVIEPSTLAARMRSGAAVVDLRPRRRFADAHLRGALNIELAVNLPTYFGWLVPFGAPFVVVSPRYEELLEARRLLATIGRELPVGWAQADFVRSLPPAQHGRYEVAGFNQLGRLYAEGEPPRLLDVRFPHEWQRGHVRNAQNIPLPEVASVIPTLSPHEETWVYCAAGYRAAIAASILSAQGLRPVLVDDVFDNAVGAGLEIVTP